MNRLLPAILIASLGGFSFLFCAPSEPVAEEEATIPEMVLEETEPLPEPRELTVEEMSATIVDLVTEKGTISIQLFPNEAPNHSRNFIQLAESGFYDGTRFHRINNEFMIQGGDPNTISGSSDTWGFGGSGRFINAEFNDIAHDRGIVSAARGPNVNSASSQFFIVVRDSPFLDGQYSAFGEVIDGMDVVDEIANGRRVGNTERAQFPVTITGTVVRSTAEESAETAAGSNGAK